MAVKLFKHGYVIASYLDLPTRPCPQPIGLATLCYQMFTLKLRSMGITTLHDDVIKWKHFPRYWPFVRGIHRSPVNSAHKGQ